jgi:hypothetical protein
VAIAWSVLAWLMLSSGASSDAPAAVIIDQLSSTDANPEFVSDVTAQIESAGYHVDYVSGSKVTVEFFRRLPRSGYDLIIVRNHVGQLERRPITALVESNGQPSIVRGEWTHPVSTFFTNEPYSRERHVEEQRQRLLGVSYYPPPSEDGGRYFGITPEFIAASDGDFDGAVIVLMGCGGPGSAAMAQAFLDKGARSVVGWDGLVTAQHTDHAIADFLPRILRGEAPASAVASTMATAGADPTFGASLWHFANGDRPRH